MIDRLLRHHGGAIRVVPVCTARAYAAQRARGPGARRFDDTEQLSGVARVLRIEVRERRRACRHCWHALAELPMVERVGADHLCHAPFAERPTPA